MAKADLRVVGEGSPIAGPAAPTVPISLRELLPLLSHAHQHGHAWLADLAEDRVLVTADLAEVLARFQQVLASKRA